MTDLLSTDLSREWAERIADQYSIDDGAAIDAIQEGLARGFLLASAGLTSGEPERRLSSEPRLDAGGGHAPVLGFKRTGSGAPTDDDRTEGMASA